MSTPAMHDAQELQRRAERLARPPVAPPPPDLQRVVAFTVGGQPCALQLGWVRHVQPLRPLAMLPFARPHVRGICGFAGRMLPVIDVGPLLGLEATQAMQSLVLIGRDAAVCALLAERIDGLHDISMGQLDHHGAVLFRSQRGGVIRGMTPAGVLLLDGEVLASLCAAPTAAPPPTTTRGGIPP